MKKEEFIKERTRIISEMIENPNEIGIFPTGNCFQELDKLYRKIMFAERGKKIDLLINYSEYLENNGFIDTDWRGEQPYPIDEFMEENK